MLNYWDRLRPELEAKGISKADLAVRIGVSYQAVKKVADGGSFGSSNNLAVARLVDVNPEWLATGKGPKNPAELMQGTATLPAPVGAEPATIGKTLEALNAKLSGLDAGTRETVAGLMHEAICKPEKAPANIAAIEALVRFATGRIETAAMAANQKA